MMIKSIERPTGFGIEESIKEGENGNHAVPDILSSTDKCTVLRVFPGGKIGIKAPALICFKELKKRP